MKKTRIAQKQMGFVLFSADQRKKQSGKQNSSRSIENKASTRTVVTDTKEKAKKKTRVKSKVKRTHIIFVYNIDSRITGSTWIYTYKPRRSNRERKVRLSQSAIHYTWNCCFLSSSSSSCLIVYACARVYK